MTHKRIVHTGADGSGCHIITPDSNFMNVLMNTGSGMTDDQAIQIIADLEVTPGDTYVFTDTASLPDRTFRPAWDVNFSSGIHISAYRAINIHDERMQRSFKEKCTWYRGQIEIAEDESTLPDVNTLKAERAALRIEMNNSLGSLSGVVAVSGTDGLANHWPFGLVDFDTRPGKRNAHGNPN